MSFIAHAQAHGLILNHAIPDGRWHRVPTTDKPRKRNGAYVFDGKAGSVRNWATMESFAFWSDGRRTAVPQMFTVNKDIEREQRAAAKRAQDLINRATMMHHGYLKSKGFPLAKGLVCDEELLIPMRDYQTYEVISVQRIKDDGTKRFMYQGRSKGAVFMLNREHQRKETWFVEGYATGLSVQAALKSLYRDAAVVVCFSAGNMGYVAKRMSGKRYVIADHDASGTGQRVAEELGVPWGMSEGEGEDANDLHSRAGLAAVRQLVLSVLKVLDRAGG